MANGFGPDGRFSGGYEPGFEGWRHGGKGKGKGKGTKGGRHGGKGKGKGKGSKDGGVRYGISEDLLMSLLGEPAGSGGPPSSATDWLDAPPEQAAAASSLTKDEVKDEPSEIPSRGEDSYTEFAGASKWKFCVQPAPPEMGEASAERKAFIEFTQAYLRASFTEAELQSMFEVVDVAVG